MRAFAESMADSQVMKGCHFFKIYDNQTVEYILVAKGGNEDAYMIGRVAVAEIQNRLWLIRSVLIGPIYSKPDSGKSAF